MDKQELERVKALRIPEFQISAADLDGEDRTLLLGYTVRRNTWHVYLKDGQIHLFVYDDVKNFGIAYSRRTGNWMMRDLVPDKRVFPERTDAEFATLLERSGVEIPFKEFNEEKWAEAQGRSFHGLMREDLPA